MTEVHEFSLRELLLHRPVIDIDDIQLMTCHFMRGLNVRDVVRGGPAGAEAWGPSSPDPTGKDGHAPAVVICGRGGSGSQFIHSAGVIHRDLKPWTLFVDLSFDEKVRRSVRARLGRKSG